MVFVATLSRLEIIEEKCLKLKNEDVNKDYYALLQQYENFSVMNVHLISGLTYQECRKDQIQQIFTHFSLDDKTLFMGDFNCDLNEVAIMPSPYQDLWQLFFPHEKGYTEDMERNSLRQTIKRDDPKAQSRRVDGIFVAPSFKDKFKQVYLLGVEGIESGQFISDHYGLACVLEM